MECLSIPTLIALVVTSALNCPWRLWRSSQKRQIRQNLSILLSDPLMLKMSMVILAWSNLLSRWKEKCCNCFLELQKITTLLSWLSCKNSVTIDNPFNANCPLLLQNSNYISILHWRKSIGNPLRTQSPMVTLIVNKLDKIHRYDDGNVAERTSNRRRQLAGWFPNTRLKKSMQRARMSSRKEVPCCTWMCASSIQLDKGYAPIRTWQRRQACFDDSLGTVVAEKWTSWMMCCCWLTSSNKVTWRTLDDCNRISHQGGKHPRYPM